MFTLILLHARVPVITLQDDYHGNATQHPRQCGPLYLPHTTREMHRCESVKWENKGHTGDKESFENIGRIAHREAQRNIIA